MCPEYFFISFFIFQKHENPSSRYLGRKTTFLLSNALKYHVISIKGLLLKERNSEYVPCVPVTLKILAEVLLSPALKLVYDFSKMHRTRTDPPSLYDFAIAGFGLRTLLLSLFTWFTLGTSLSILGTKEVQDVLDSV